jgi:hypothetical protein
MLQQGYKKGAKRAQKVCRRQAEGDQMLKQESETTGVQQGLQQACTTRKGERMRVGMGRGVGGGGMQERCCGRSGEGCGGRGREGCENEQD